MQLRALRDNGARLGLQELGWFEQPQQTAIAASVAITRAKLTKLVGGSVGTKPILHVDSFMIS